MKKRILTQILLLVLVAAMCMLASCNEGTPGPKGDTGETGNGIADIVTERTDGGTKVTIKYTDTSKEDVVFVIPDGAKGETGETGADGRGILKTEIINGCLWVTYSDAPYAPVNVGRVTAESTTPDDPPVVTPPVDEPIDMEGYVYKAYVRYFAGTDPDPTQAQAQNGNNDYYCTDFWVSEENSETDLLSYTVYNRNQAIENEYNCKIQQISSEGSQLEHLAMAYLNGDCYELTIILAQVAAQAAAFNLLRDLNATTYLDLSSPSYDQNSIRELSVADKLYFLSGDMNISTMDVLALSLVNMELYHDLADVFVEEFEGDPAYTNIYNIVLDHKWTMETMMTMAELANFDINPNDGSLSAADKGDMVGYYQYLYSPIWYFYGSGGRITEKTSGGIPRLVVQNAHEEELYDYLFCTFNRINYVPWLSSGASATVNRNFLTGNVLFTDSTLFNVRTEIYPHSEFEYGLLPIPVLEGGMDYQSVVYFNNWAHLWAIPTMSADLEYAERMMQIMAESSTDTTMDGYYRTIYLQAAPSNGSREVLNMIQFSMVYDMALIYGWGEIDEWVNQVASGYNYDYGWIMTLLSDTTEEINATVELLKNPIRLEELQ